MITPSDDTFEGRVAQLEAFLDEVDRRTFSDFSVTNPVTGVKNLEVGPVPGGGYQVAIRDSNGNVIYGNRPDIGIQGFRMPMPMYPSIPYGGGLTATSTTWVTVWEIKTQPTSTEIQCAYRFSDLAPAGGTTETRVAYDVGAGLVVMPTSTSSGVNPNNATKSFVYVWPADYFDTEIQIMFQVRISTGSGSGVISPMYMVGG